VKRLSVACFSMLLLLGLASQGLAADKPPLSKLAVWEGHYVDDQIEGHDLFAEPAFMERVKEILGPERMKIFENEFMTGVTVPIEKKGDVMLFNFCKTHDCMNYVVYIYADLAANTMDMCWMRRTEIVSYWLTAFAKPQDIGVAGCADDTAFPLYQKYHKK